VPVEGGVQARKAWEQGGGGTRQWGGGKFLEVPTAASCRWYRVVCATAAAALALP
jgi:hypothetical protein